MALAFLPYRSTVLCGHIFTVTASSRDVHCRSVRLPRALLGMLRSQFLWGLDPLVAFLPLGELSRQVWLPVPRDMKTVMYCAPGFGGRAQGSVVFMSFSVSLT